MTDKRPTLRDLVYKRNVLLREVQVLNLEIGSRISVPPPPGYGAAAVLATVPGARRTFSQAAKARMSQGMREYWKRRRIAAQAKSQRVRKAPRKPAGSAKAATS